MNRRHWLQLTAILSAARTAPGQQPAAPATAPPSVTRDQLATALKLMELEFPDDQLDLMLPNIRRSLAGYDRLRKIDVPLDTEPAFTFHPGMPEVLPKAGPARYRPAKVIPKTKSQWSKPEDLAYLPAEEIGALLRAKRISSRELTRLYLDRLKTYSPKLNCAITITEELALEQASRADKEIARGRYRGPLHGIPWGAKDLFDTKGIRTTFGAEPYQERIPKANAIVVDRLEKAGAVLVAKLSMGALAMGGLWFGGMTKTPWNVERTSSGSSAGSAAGTAAGLVGFALGTETLGSIVTPCVRCGATGLRPTYGRVPRTGAMGLSWTMDKIGPICRSVTDCALVLNAIHGPDGRDRSVLAAPFHWEPAKPLSSLRIAYLPKAFEAMKGKEKEVYDEALASLRKAGVTPKPLEWDDKMGQDIRFLLTAEAAAAFDDITRNGQVNQLKGQGANDWPNSFRTSRLIPAVEYIRAQRARTLLIRKTEELLAGIDVVITPPFAVMTTTNLTGHPQVVVPCGFLEGLPLGLSFIGRLYDEGSPLRVALAYQQATDWHKKRPPLT